ncbi:Pre-mRNA splicing factor ATP-dependent RNA helicase PRP22 [Aphelenchoides avenae]|nr:Pre-mRNA splicing factor ATP-dependent RNA helicase PRP22 [Aphelenchus avenae]
MNHLAVQVGHLAPPGPSAVMQKRRQSLPIYHYRGEIIDTLYALQVVILQGGTGSGKTTQLVQYILEVAKHDGILGLIGCTQPR